MGSPSPTSADYHSQLSKNHSAYPLASAAVSTSARTTRTAVKRGFHSSTVVSSQVRSARQSDSPGTEARGNHPIGGTSCPEGTPSARLKAGLGERSAAPGETPL